MSDVQILSQRKSGAVLIESRHEEGQTDKQRLHQRKSSDGVLTTYTRYVLLRAASEEFWGGVKHDLAYELWGRLAAEFWAFLPAVETYQMVTPVTTVRDYDWLMYQMQRLFSSGFFSSERFFFFFESGFRLKTWDRERGNSCPLSKYAWLYSGLLQAL